MRWEYIRVQIGNSSTGRMGHIAPAAVWVIDNDGNEVEWKKQKGDRSHSAVVGRLLTKLGDDGWELTGVVGDRAGDTILYFKRPKMP